MTKETEDQKVKRRAKLFGRDGKKDGKKYDKTKGKTERLPEMQITGRDAGQQLVDHLLGDAARKFTNPKTGKTDKERLAEATKSLQEEYNMLVKAAKAAKGKGKQKRGMARKY